MTIEELIQILEKRIEYYRTLTKIATCIEECLVYQGKTEACKSILWICKQGFQHSEDTGNAGEQP